MDFEWDIDKNRKNKKRHGVDFEFASKVFIDPNLLSRIDDRVDYGETREIALAMYLGVILSVVYTWRGDRIRIISARKATKYEQRRYYEGIFG
ncbi:MAG: hypothetical protein CSB24_03460 [Deltaproteobacteria bacterium]|nr:MAG: hypothetical protein CSB24_03460 [Deltaproteobacteria bacterium]